MTAVLPAAESTSELAPQATAGGRQLFGSYGIDEVSGEGYGRRALAKIIDILLLNVVEFIAMAVFMVVVSVMGTARGIPSDVLMTRLQATTFASIVLSTVAFVLYFTVFEWLGGSTPGKRALGMVVVTESLGSCPLAAALKRNALLLPEMLFWTIPVFIGIRNSNRAQRHGDQWAGTIVPLREKVPAAVRGTADQLLVAGVIAMGTTIVLMGLVVFLKARPLLAGV
jgi:uncharacterized RDD family membrane protein YckC